MTQHGAGWRPVQGGICLGGTMLATARGMRDIAGLGSGDVLVAGDGAMGEVHWIGRVRLSVAELASRPEFWPVQVRAGALADGLPPQATQVLPDHALLVPGFSPVAARWLVNGVSLRRTAPASPVDFYSVELVEPATLAWAGFLLAPHPGPPPDDAMLLGLRHHLAARAGLQPGRLIGGLDTLDQHHAAGWVGDTQQPVAVEVVVDGVRGEPVVGQPCAPGRTGFAWRVALALDPARVHLVQVRRAVDGAVLSGTPVLLDAAVGLVDILGQVAAADALGDALRATARKLMSGERAGAESASF